MTPSPDLHGKVIVITGAARGIGLATAAALRSLGAKVAIGDIDEATLKESATELGLTAYGKLDVTDVEAFTAFLDHVEEDLGPIDVLINNAGIMPTGRLIDEPASVTRRIVDINILGVINGSKLAAQRMVPRGAGHVINVASLAGQVGFTDAARRAPRDRRRLLSDDAVFRQHRTHRWNAWCSWHEERRTRRHRRRNRRPHRQPQISRASDETRRRIVSGPEVPTADHRRRADPRGPQ